MKSRPSTYGNFNGRHTNLSDVTMDCTIDPVKRKVDKARVARHYEFLNNALKELILAKHTNNLQLAQSANISVDRNVQSLIELGESAEELQYHIAKKLE